MGDQLKSLYDSVNNLGEGKKQADKKQYELDDLHSQFENLYFDKNSV